MDESFWISLGKQPTKQKPLSLLQKVLQYNHNSRVKSIPLWDSISHKLANQTATNGVNNVLKFTLFDGERWNLFGWKWNLTVTNMIDYTCSTS